MSDDQNNYQTTDTLIATYLCTLDYKITRIVKANRTQAIYIFDVKANNSKLKEKIDKFANYEGNIFNFFNQYKLLKNKARDALL